MSQYLIIDLTVYKDMKKQFRLCDIRVSEVQFVLIALQLGNQLLCLLFSLSQL